MSYIGSSATPLPVAFSGVRTQSFNGTGSQTTFTLSRAVSAVTDIEVVVNNVQQSPYDSSYNISGATLTFSEAPSSGTNNIYVIFRDQPVGSLTDPTSVKKAGDTMTGKLTVSNDLLFTHRIESSNTNAVVGEISNTTSGAVWETSVGGSANAVAGNGWFYIYKQGFGAALKADTAGRVLLPCQPCYVGVNMSASISPQSFTKIVHATTQVNDGNHMVNGTFTCPVAGRYAVTFHALTRSNTAHNIEVRKNGAYWTAARDIAPSGEQCTGLATVVKCSASDTIEIYVQAETSSGDFYVSWNQTSIVLLG